MAEAPEPTRDDTSAVQEPTAENGASRKQSNLAVWSYVLYNFGNTPFQLTILVLYFPLWLAEQYGAGPALFNYATSVAALLVVLIAPALGALADLHQSRLRYLVGLTLITVLFTFGLGFTDALTGSLFVAIVVFVVAVVAYQLIQVPYYAPSRGLNWNLVGPPRLRALCRSEEILRTFDRRARRNPTAFQSCGCLGTDLDRRCRLQHLPADRGLFSSLRSARLFLRAGCCGASSAAGKAR
jgi:hypothetical protein